MPKLMPAQFAQAWGGGGSGGNGGELGGKMYESAVFKSHLFQTHSAPSFFMPDSCFFY